jgi:hypothetical protein
MRILKTYEIFKESDYLKRKEKKILKLAQSLGDHYITEIVANGDFEGLNYLLNTGYDLKKCEADNLLTVAIKSDQKEMIDYLINKSDYFEDAGWNDKPINSVSITDLIGEKSYDENKVNEVTPQAIEWLKTITELGYDFGGKHNLIELYLCDVKYNKETRNYNQLIKGAEPFIDWLLKNHPKNYPLAKDILPDNLNI